MPLGPASFESSLSLFSLKDNQLHSHSLEDAFEQPVWIDYKGVREEIVEEILRSLTEYSTLRPALASISTTDLGYLTSRYNQERIKISRHFFYFHLIIVNPHKKETVEKIRFFITPQAVLTLRDGDSALFANLLSDAVYELSDLSDLIYSFFFELLDWTAGLLEEQGEAVDLLNQEMFHSTDSRLDHTAVHGPGTKSAMGNIILHIGRVSHVSMKAQQSLDGLNRALQFFLNSSTSKELVKPKTLERLETLLSETSSQQASASGIIQNLAYMSDAAIGILGNNQNEIIKFLTIMATVLVPPTFIVALAEVDFEGRPSLEWPWGIILLVGIMVLSSYSFYKILKKKRLL